MFRMTTSLRRQRQDTKQCPTSMSSYSGTERAGPLMPAACLSSVSRRVKLPPWHVFTRFLLLEWMAWSRWQVCILINLLPGVFWCCSHAGCRLINTRAAFHWVDLCNKSPSLPPPPLIAQRYELTQHIALCQVKDLGAGCHVNHVNISMQIRGHMLLIGKSAILEYNRN